MKIRGKIFYSVMSMSFVLFSVVVLYLSWNFRETTLNISKKLADSYAMQSANFVKSELDADMAAVSSLAHIYTDFDKIVDKDRSIIYQNMMKRLLKSHPKFLSMWVSWEYSAIKKNWIKPYGRERTQALKKRNGEIDIIIDQVNMDGDDYNSTYYKLKISKDVEFVIDPYFYTYSVKELKDSILETSLAVKVMKNNKYKALVGVDVQLTELQEIIENKIPFDSSYMFLVANNGTFVAHPNKQLVGKGISTIQNLKDNEFNYEAKIATGQEFSMNTFDKDGNIVAYTTFAPIYIGKSKTPWSIGLSVPIEIITKEATENFYYALIAGIIGLLLMTVVIYFISENITTPLHRTIKVMHKIDSGDIGLENKLIIRRKDEIGEMSKSLNLIIDRLNVIANFAVNVGKGNLDEKFKAVSNHDILANALIDMRNNLKTAKDERVDRISETQKRTWFQNGVSEIGDILQQSHENIEELSYKLLKKTIKYLEAAQGGFFTINENETKKTLNMLSSFAYDKRKKLIDEVEFGEGLVGRCAVERQIIVINNIPQGYTYISSGLGEESPKTIVLTPLIHDNTVLGVIEIATFKELDNFQKDFLEVTSQRIAAVISNIKITNDTKKLLEEFKKQAAELEKQEIETQKTIKILEATQSDIKEKEAEGSGIIQALVSVASVVFYDMNGKITQINQKNQELFNIKAEDYIGKTHFEVLDEAKENPEWFQKFWKDLNNGKQRVKEYYLKHDTKEIWLIETFTPILNEAGKPIKVINIGIDITERKLLERKIEKLEKELNK